MDAPNPPPKLSKAAIAALAAALLGLAFFPFSALAVLLGVVGILATRRGLQRGRGLAVLALVLAPFTLITTGFEAVVFERMFGSPQEMALTFEPRLYLPMLMKGVKRARERDGKLPPALARTPKDVPCGPQVWPAGADPGWKALGFSPGQPLRFAYEYAPDPDGKSFTLRAYGDLNCDGKLSRYELREGDLKVRVEDGLE